MRFTTTASEWLSVSGFRQHIKPSPIANYMSTASHSHATFQLPLADWASAARHYHHWCQHASTRYMSTGPIPNPLRTFRLRPQWIFSPRGSRISIELRNKTERRERPQGRPLHTSKWDDLGDPEIRISVQQPVALRRVSNATLPSLYADPGGHPMSYTAVHGLHMCPTMERIVLPTSADY